MEPAAHFTDLMVWQKAHAFVLASYRATARFPKSETYGLTSQFRRAAVSIPANIAEGFRRKGLPEKARFLNIAQASLEECRYYLILSRDLGYAQEPALPDLAVEVSKLLTAYERSVLNRLSV
jgi:four helix bundle protein